MSEAGTERFGPRVESVFCVSCGETWGVWTDPKHRECWGCGQVVYDDYDTSLKVGEQLGGRFTATDGGNSRPVATDTHEDGDRS